MEKIIFICGIYNIGFAIFHTGFWKIFHWNQDLKKLRFENKAIIQILNIQIIYFFLFTAIICFAFPDELLNTAIGKWFLVGNSIFWILRTINQFIFLRSKHFMVHVLTIIFILGSFLFVFPLILN
ncbi:MAG: hypothetical protein IPQ23_18970 [Cytophagaceae bacterium]|nr:hypothetical protein [Cytophagaceae bacterium]